MKYITTNKANRNVLEYFLRMFFHSFIQSLIPTCTHWNCRHDAPWSPLRVSFPLVNIWNMFPLRACFPFRIFVTFCFIFLFCARFCSLSCHSEDLTQFLTGLISIYWIVFMCRSERFYQVFTMFIARWKA